MSGGSKGGGSQPLTNGAALAAVLAAGIGAFAMGLFVILNEAKLFVAPSLYAPVGGLSGRSTFAVIVWLAAWALLHARWRARELESGRVLVWTLVLTAVGAVLVFPPVWGLL
jgi:hypothetical protein